jgi:ABC-2 type transport system ATP-binding protein
MAEPILRVSGLSKVYENGFTALDAVSLDIEEGEIIALLGPNGAGKTTLIGTICGLVQPTGGSVTVAGHDTATAFREARSLIGLVPQEVNLEPFEKVATTVNFSRGLFGKKRDDALVERVLRQLSLWNKRDSPIRSLSGGMKRRVLIAKALAHEPRILFLDEPTAGVDVELRRDMWEVVRGLKDDGVTIILTTHYLEEAEAMADRIGVINKGRILLVEEKAALMKRLGRKELVIELREPLAEIPAALAAHGLRQAGDGHRLIYTYDSHGERTGITGLLADVRAAGLHLTDVETRQSSLEEIFVGLVAESPAEARP